MQPQMVNKVSNYSPCFRWNRFRTRCTHCFHMVLPTILDYLQSLVRLVIIGHNVRRIDLINQIKAKQHWEPSKMQEKSKLIWATMTVLDLDCHLVHAKPWENITQTSTPPLYFIKISIFSSSTLFHRKTVCRIIEALSWFGHYFFKVSSDLDL